MTFEPIFGILRGMENDLKMDTRKNPENLYAVRMMIVRLSKRGLGPMAIKEQTGVSWGAIRKAIDLYACLSNYHSNLSLVALILMIRV